MIPYKKTQLLFFSMHDPLTQCGQEEEDTKGQSSN